MDGTSGKCHICCKRSTGIYYKVEACVGCRSFYRRCLKRGGKYVCKLDGHCSTHFNSGKQWCVPCRYWKYAALHAEKLQQIQQDSTSQSSSPHNSAFFGEELSPLPRETLLISGTNRAPSPVIIYVRSYPATLTITQQELSETISAVESAVEQIFGDQIASWTECRDRASKYGKVVHHPHAQKEDILTAINEHKTNNFLRTQKFAAVLPGIGQLGTGLLRFMAAHWKVFLCSVLHHAPFCSDNEMYVTIGVGPYQIQYSRYWQESITNWSFQVFVYRVCTEIRALELEQTERYLLMIMIMLEPGGDHLANPFLNIIHRHYADALLYAIERRCDSPQHFTKICRKLERFLDDIKSVTERFSFYFQSPNACPPCSVGRSTKLWELDALR